MDLRLLLEWNGLLFALFVVLLGLFLLRRRRQHSALFVGRSDGLAVMMVFLVISRELARSIVAMAVFVLSVGALWAGSSHSTDGEANAVTDYSNGSRPLTLRQAGGMMYMYINPGDTAR